MGVLSTPESLATDDFLIRSWTEHDGPAMWEAVDSSRQHLAHMPWIDAQTSVTDSTIFVRRARGQYLLDIDYGLGVWTPDGKTVVGSTGYHLGGRPREPELSAEIGMWIRADRAGQGLGTAVLQTLLAWGFEAWGWLRLVWRCDQRNTASRRCAQKAGMRREGSMLGEYDHRTGGRRETIQFGLCARRSRAALEP